MTVVDPAPAAAVLDARARHKLRSRGRNAAGHLWTCLMTTTSVDAARRAIKTFGDELVQADALELLDRLTRQRPPESPVAGGDKREALHGGPARSEGDS